MNSRIRKCYIAAPAGANLTILRDILHGKGIEIAVPNQLPIGSDWQDEIKSLIADVDLVIGVFTTASKSSFVLFELGQSWALDRQILLLVPPKYSSLPSGLERFLVVRALHTNREAINFALDQLIAAPTTAKRATTPNPSELRNLNNEADVLLLEIRDAINSSAHQNLERLAARALRQSGVEVMAEDLNDRVDFAIWSDALQASTGNPVIVEVKTRIEKGGQGRSVLQNFSSQIASSGAQWGLLLYGEGPSPGDRLWRSAPPNVLALSLPTLVERMRNQPFAAVIRDLRNTKMHGGTF